jgi:hypothetical protein
VPVCVVRAIHLIDSKAQLENGRGRRVHGRREYEFDWWLVYGWLTHHRPSTSFSSLILLFSFLILVPILISDENERKWEENRSINLLPVYYLIGISAVDTHPTPEFR